MKAALTTAAPKVTDGFHDWWAGALCASFDPDFFFDRAEEDPDTAAAAKSVCFSCPIRRQCLNASMLANEEYGIWGGLDARERAAYRPTWMRSNGGRGVVRTLRERNGIAIHDPSIDRRYSARLRAAQECYRRAVAAGPFHRRDEYLTVLELIMAYPTEDATKLGTRAGYSKAWFNGVKRDAYKMFNVREIYESETA